MAEKRYFSVDYGEEYYIFDSTKISGEEVLEKAEYSYDVFGESLMENEVLNLLNENEQLIKCIEQLTEIIDNNIPFNRVFDIKELNDICNELGWEVSEKEIKLKQLKKENEQLKQRVEHFEMQLHCDKEEGVCSICNNHYLIKGKTYDKYYISKCKKGNDECSTDVLTYCEDFELKDDKDD